MCGGCCAERLLAGERRHHDAARRPCRPGCDARVGWRYRRGAGSRRCRRRHELFEPRRHDGARKGARGARPLARGRACVGGGPAGRHGDADDHDRRRRRGCDRVAQPVLEVLGESFFRTGPLGSGHAMKALNNFVGGGTYALVVEALAIGRRYGLTPSTMIDVMNASTGRSFNTEVVFKDHVLTGGTRPGSRSGCSARTSASPPSWRGRAAWTHRCASSSAGAGRGPRPSSGLAADHSEAHKSWWSTICAAAETPRRPMSPRRGGLQVPRREAQCPRDRRIRCVPAWLLRNEQE